MRKLKFWKYAGLAVLLVGGLGCRDGKVVIPPCLLDGTLCQPSPEPSPCVCKDKCGREYESSDPYCRCNPDFRLNGDPCPTCPDGEEWNPIGGPHQTGGCTPIPTPSPSPSPSPTPAPSPTPTPVPSPSPTPTPEPPGCVADDIKIGFRASIPKARGARNTFDLTPTYRGVAIKPETGCGEPLIAKYGEFQRFQEGANWSGRHPVEVQSDNPYILVDATNSDDDPSHWSGDTYLLTGFRRFCVSWPHLNHWRCQDGEMDSRGRLVGFGTNSQGYDLPK